MLLTTGLYPTQQRPSRLGCCPSRPVSCRYCRPGLVPVWVRRTCLRTRGVLLHPTLLAPDQRHPVQQPRQAQLHAVPPVQHRLNQIRRQQRKPQNATHESPLDPLGSRHLADAAVAPLIGIRCHRNARASAFTSAGSVGPSSTRQPSAMPPCFDVHRKCSCASAACR